MINFSIKDVNTTFVTKKLWDDEFMCMVPEFVMHTNQQKTPLFNAKNANTAFALNSHRI